MRALPAYGGNEFGTFGGESQGGGVAAARRRQRDGINGRLWAIVRSPLCFEVEKFVLPNNC